MLKNILLIALIWMIASNGFAQPGTSAPPGFDVKTELMAYGKRDSITYSSKTAGANRRSVIYTPPGYSTSKRYPVLYLLHGIGGDEKEWSKGGVPHIILDKL